MGIRIKNEKATLRLHIFFEHWGVVLKLNEQKRSMSCTFIAILPNLAKPETAIRSIRINCNSKTQRRPHEWAMVTHQTSAAFRALIPPLDSSLAQLDCEEFSVPPRTTGVATILPSLPTWWETTRECAGRSPKPGQSTETRGTWGSMQCPDKYKGNDFFCE